MMNGIGVQIPGFNQIPTTPQPQHNPMTAVGTARSGGGFPVGGYQQPAYQPPPPPPQPSYASAAFNSGGMAYASGNNTFLETALMTPHAAGSIDTRELNKVMDGIRHVESSSGYTLIAPGEENKAPFLTLINTLNALHVCLVDTYTAPNGTQATGYLGNWLPNGQGWDEIRKNSGQLASLLIQFKDKIKTAAGITDKI